MTKFNYDKPGVARAVLQTALLLNLIVNVNKKTNWLYIQRKRQISCQLEERGQLAVSLKKESINLL